MMTVKQASLDPIHTIPLNGQAFFMNGSFCRLNG